VYWGATAAGVCLLAPLAPQVAAALPECVFHSVTGLPCPVCGATRAALALSHLDIASALALNPLASLGALAFVLGGFAAGIAALSGRPIRLPAAPTSALRLAAILAVAANWGWLLLHVR
jgi:hypothetical protein